MAKTKIKIFEMFSGTGGASFSLKKANIPFKCIGFSEIDKYAVQCYKQNHGDIKNFGDCTKINPDELPCFDLLTGGFPCQSFSVAGKGLGEQDTRGTLFNEIIRIAEVKKPKYMLLENVKGLLSKKHKQTFDKILSELKRIGYFVHYNVLNSKKHGIPQNRERVWFVCFRDEDEFYKFEYPEEQELKIFLKDILEKEVDEKYYLSKEQTAKLLQSTRHTSAFKEPKCIQVNNPSHSNNRVYGEEGISPTLNTMQGGNRQPFILSQPLKFLNRNQKKLQGKYSGCVDSCNTNGVRIKQKIRKLTPAECFRLMGFLNNEINLEGLSNSQKYKLAGNGWDINIVSKILKNMRFTNNKRKANGKIRFSSK